MWISPLPYNLIPTTDSQSFVDMPKGTTGIPTGSHVGAFGVVRKHHIHEGVDLYAQQGCPVLAVEDGEVVAVLPFTGEHAGSPWWLNTYAVFVEGESGVVVYGEVASHTKVGRSIHGGEMIGVVTRVLRHDKGRPTRMLHLELHCHGSRNVVEWNLDRPNPTVLQDPTDFLLQSQPYCRRLK